MTEKELEVLELRYVEACNKEPFLLNASILYLQGLELPVLGDSIKRRFNRDILPYCRAVLFQNYRNNEENQ